MSELTEWLLARIAEDEAAIKAAGTDWIEISEYMVRELRPEAPIVFTEKRMLAECEAKRLLIDLAFDHAAIIDGEWGCCHGSDALKTGIIKAEGDWEEDEPLPDSCDAVKYAAPQLRALASIYVDHPDCREEWRP